MANIVKSLKNTFINISNINQIEQNNIIHYINDDLLLYVNLKKEEFLKKIYKIKFDYEKNLYLEKIGFLNAKNLKKFDKYQSQYMFKLLELFTKNEKSFVNKFPTLLKKDFKEYCNDNNMEIHSKESYTGEIFDFEYEKLKYTLEKLEKSVPFENFYKIEYSSSREYWHTLDTEDDIIPLLKDNKDKFLNSDGDFNYYYYYRISYKPIYRVENKDKNNGFYVIELYDNIMTILFDWNNTPNPLRFSEYVDKHKIKSLE